MSNTASCTVAAVACVLVGGLAGCGGEDDSAAPSTHVATTDPPPTTAPTSRPRRQDAAALATCLTQTTNGIVTPLARGAIYVVAGAPRDSSGSVVYSVLVVVGRSADDAAQKLTRVGAPVVRALHRGRPVSWRGASANVVYEGVGPLASPEAAPGELERLGARAASHAKTVLRRCLREG